MCKAVVGCKGLELRDTPFDRAKTIIKKKISKTKIMNCKHSTLKALYIVIDHCCWCLLLTTEIRYHAHCKKWFSYLEF